MTTAIGERIARKVFGWAILGVGMMTWGALYQTMLALKMLLAPRLEIPFLHIHDHRDFAWYLLHGAMCSLLAMLLAALALRAFARTYCPDADAIPATGKEAAARLGAVLIVPKLLVYAVTPCVRAVFPDRRA